MSRFVSEPSEILECWIVAHVLSIKFLKNFDKIDNLAWYNIKTHKYNITGLDSDGMSVIKVGNFEKCTSKIPSEGLYQPANIT